MQSLDNEFFEEYKRLDRLCSDMFSSRIGVSAYIEAMEAKAAQGQFLISSWDSDYRALKHIRWVRNQIAHDSGVVQISSDSDLIFTEDFYRRVLSRQDPLALLTISEQARKAALNRKQANKSISSQPRHSSSFGEHSAPVQRTPLSGAEKKPIAASSDPRNAGSWQTQVPQKRPETASQRHPLLFTAAVILILLFLFLLKYRVI